MVWGAMYIYKPQWMIALHAMIKDTLFNDSHVLLHGKRYGFYLLIFGFLLVSFVVIRPH